MKNKIEEIYLFIVNHKEKIFMIVNPPIYNGGEYDKMVNNMIDVNSSSVPAQNFEEAISDWKNKGYKQVPREIFIKNTYSS